MQYYSRFVNPVVQYVSRIYNKPDRTEAVLQMLGLSIIAYLSLGFLGYIWRTIQRCLPRNLIQRYGANSWAVVTGASDGIGKGFCQELASQGFNIVLIARNKDKLEKVVQEIKAINPSVQTKVVIADFSKSTNPGFFDEIYSQIKDLDISLLINNVGVDAIEKFHDLAEKEIQGMINVNIYPTLFMTRKLIDKMRNRKTRSGIINVASTAASHPLPFLGTYGATKKLMDHFSCSLRIEYPELDILSLRPGYVSTAMTGFKAVSLDTISVEQCVKGALKDLGRKEISYAHWKHDLLAFAMSSIPKRIRDFVSKNFALPVEMKRRAAYLKKEH